MSGQYLVLLLLFGGVFSVEVQRPRGVPLSKRPLYEEDKPFTCLDGSRTIPFDRVNDDYCDCQDGSDEPGTAACPHGSFHCTNAGFRPTFIPSSRVNDGICDCCDATDEYNSGADCQNTCRELWRKEKESMEKLAEIAKEGFLLKQQLTQEATRGLEEKKSKLTEVQNSKKDLEEKVEALRTVKETAEQPEKEAKDRHLKAWEEQKAVIRLEKDKARMAEVFLELDGDGDGFVSVAELLSHSELDQNSDGSFTEAEAQELLGGVDKLDTAGFESVWSKIKEKYMSESNTDAPAPGEPPHEEVKEPVSDNESEPYPDDDNPEEEEEEDDEGDDDEMDDGDYKSPPPTETHEKKDDDEDGTMPPYDEETQKLIDGECFQTVLNDDGGQRCPVAPVHGSPPSVSVPQGSCDYNVVCHHQCVNVCSKALWGPEGLDKALHKFSPFTVEAAQKTRDEFDEAEKSLRELDDNIRNLEKEISFDFGPSMEFAYLYSQCYELTTGEYVYRLCPFNRVSQKPKYGGSETNLGTWGKWAGPEDNIYSVMKYEHGTGCWQGPNRSTTVKLTCGTETVVMSTSEPSRCEYLMEFTSPAVCQEPPPVTSDPEHDEL